MSNEIHLIQYRDTNGCHETSAVCPRHKSMLMGIIREQGLGCTGTVAPMLSRCDGCEMENA